MKEVSVIIPVYNAESSIIRTLNSVIKQTIKPLEIIIIDDGSTDRSSEIINNFITSHSNFDFIFLKKKNGGVSSARNAGLKIAKGNFVALIDSDDEWIYNKTEEQIDYLIKNDEISFIGGLIMEPNKEDKGKSELINVKKLIFKNYFQPSTVLFKRCVMDSVGFFDEDQNYAEEGNYFMRIANLFKCVLISEKVVIYDEGKLGFGVSGLSANLLEMEKGELKNIKYAFKAGYVSVFTFTIATLYSVLKYVRRILIIKSKND